MAVSPSLLLLFLTLTTVVEAPGVVFGPLWWFGISFSVSGVSCGDVTHGLEWQGLTPHQRCCLERIKKLMRDDFFLDDGHDSEDINGARSPIMTTIYPFSGAKWLFDGIRSSSVMRRRGCLGFDWGAIACPPRRVTRMRFISACRAIFFGADDWDELNSPPPPSADQIVSLHCDVTAREVYHGQTISSPRRWLVERRGCPNDDAWPTVADKYMSFSRRNGTPALLASLADERERLSNRT